MKIKGTCGPEKSQMNPDCCGAIPQDFKYPYERVGEYADFEIFLRIWRHNFMFGIMKSRVERCEIFQNGKFST